MQNILLAISKIMELVYTYKHITAKIKCLYCIISLIFFFDIICLYTAKKTVHCTSSTLVIIIKYF